MPRSPIVSNRKQAFLATAFLVGLALVAVVAWRFIRNLEPRARWLEVEAPSYAVAGEVLDIRVKLGDIPEPSRIDGILVTRNRRHEPRGQFKLVKVSGEPRRGGTCVLSFAVEERPDVESVSAIIVLTPTGAWQDTTNGAVTVPIPVRSKASAESPPVLGRVSVYPWAPAGASEAGSRGGGRRFRQAQPPKTPLAGRLGIFALLAAGSLISLALARRAKGPRLKKWRFSCALWRCLGGFLFLAGAGELLGLDEKVTGLGRMVALEAHFYYMRRSFQAAAIVFLATLAVGLAVLSVAAVARGRLRFRGWLAAMGALGYLTLGLVDLLSFHYVDRLKAILIVGLPFLDILKVLSLLVLIVGLLLSLRAAGPDSGTRQ